MLKKTSRAYLGMALLLAMLVTVGCGEVVTVTVWPESAGEDCTSKHHDSNETWCLDLPSYGLACEGPEGVISANSLMVFSSPLTPPQSGWGDSYDSGTQPFACPWWVSTFNRAYVKFNLTNVVLPAPAISVEYASLHWITNRVTGNSKNACIKYLYEATGPWQQGNPSKALLFGNLDTTAVKAGFFGVTGSAQKWFLNPSQNFGFIFEPSRNYTQQYSSSECTDGLQDLSMTVKYRVKK